MKTKVQIFLKSNPTEPITGGLYSKEGSNQEAFDTFESFMEADTGCAKLNGLSVVHLICRSDVSYISFEDVEDE